MVVTSREQDSLIQIDNSEDIENVVHLDNSMISPDSSLMVT